MHFNKFPIIRNPYFHIFYITGDGNQLKF